MKIESVPIPEPEPGARFKPHDFDEVFASIPKDCILIGGQAVAWWAERYAIKNAKGQLVDANSKDIDFWGKHHDLFEIAKRLNKRPALPNKHQMTALIGALKISVSGRDTVMELLHRVPGLDVENPKAVAIPETVTKTGHEILILTPVSLVLTKLYNLRRIPQEQRQDLFHLRISLNACRSFISEVLLENAKFALWNCNRLIQAHRQARNQRLERSFGFNILNGIPIENIQVATQLPQIDADNRERLKKFLTHLWPRVSKDEGPTDSPIEIS